MAITRNKKVEIVEELERELPKAGSVVFANFHGLSVADSTKLRNILKANGARFKVMKKSLLRRALKSLSLAGDEPKMDGEVGIAYSTDAVISAKELASFAKAHKEKFSLLGGVLEGRYLSVLEVNALANVPSRDELLSKLVYVLSGPSRGFVRVLAGVPEAFVRVLDAMGKIETVKN
ncbi:MAG: 50S ribosomal protein L10 [Patescibacteria group bacterium]